MPPGAQEELATASASAVGDPPATGDDEAFPQRDGLPPDPKDPEPIESTGSNSWDLITADDPSALVCVRYVGTGEAEILAQGKEGYESVQGVYLYRAGYDDGTSLDLRVHPEVGPEADAQPQVQAISDALGRLPARLRERVERVALREGDQTATGSAGEGISLQSGNLAVRMAEDRLEETLFHESVHTGLDRELAYQRSPEWMTAQQQDGRWLTVYGRENPDSEDLAETALYAWAALNHPDRFPAGLLEQVRGRVPHRIAFLEPVLSDLGMPAGRSDQPEQPCSG